MDPGYGAFAAGNGRSHMTKKARLTIVALLVTALTFAAGSALADPGKNPNGKTPNLGQSCAHANPNGLASPAHAFCP
jgi:hypothetical protein